MFKSIISVLLEIVFIFVEHFSYDKGTPPIIKFLSRIFLIICTVCASIILFICLCVCVDMFLSGNVGDAVKMLIITLMVAIGSYIRFIHRFIQMLCKNKHINWNSYNKTGLEISQVLFFYISWIRKFHPSRTEKKPSSLVRGAEAPWPMWSLPQTINPSEHRYLANMV